jgi:hypothetical protein
MYTHVQIAGAAHHAAIDCYQQTGNILLDSSARLFDLYRDTGRRAVGLARRDAAQPGRVLVEELAPVLFAGHLRLAGHAWEDYVRLVEAQIHSTSRVALFALEKSAQLSPPLVEIAIESTESIICVGESTADAISAASLEAVRPVEKAAAQMRPAKAGGSRKNAPTRTR